MSSTSAVDIRTHAVSALSMVTSFLLDPVWASGAPGLPRKSPCRTAMEVPAPPLQCKPDLGGGMPDPQRCPGSTHCRHFRLIPPGDGFFGVAARTPTDFARIYEIVRISRN